MGRYIARQPNGLLCRFSTVVDCVTVYNMTEEDYIELCAEEALNKYPAAELRRVSEDGGTVGQWPLSQESIVTGQKNDCHEDCRGIVQSIKRIQSVGYITNVTK